MMQYFDTFYLLIIAIINFFLLFLYSWRTNNLFLQFISKKNLRVQKQNMSDKRLIKISHKLSYHLRHAPEKIGLILDSSGWADVETLLAKLHITRTELDECVSNSDKQRFSFDETHTKIRANQGHSIKIDLDLPVTKPPETLYHGTVERFMNDILKDGLRPMSRLDVHLSSSIETAKNVGSRRGKSVVLVVNSGAMFADGLEFRVSSNGVWLTSHVPPKYLSKS